MPHMVPWLLSVSSACYTRKALKNIHTSRVYIYIIFLSVCICVCTVYTYIYIVHGSTRVKLTESDAKLTGLCQWPPLLFKSPSAKEQRAFRAADPGLGAGSILFGV